MEMEVREAAIKKAVLVTGAPVKVPEDFKPPFPLSRSTAGPGAGLPSIVLSFEGTRVKKPITKEEAEFELVEGKGGYSLRRLGEPFIDHVEIQPTIYHSPGQAFINLDHRCIYDCKFCKSGKLERDYTKNLTHEKVVDMVLKASQRPDFKAAAFTSAVVESPSETVLKLARVISEVRFRLGPQVPIGVEPYVSSREDIDRLKAAGADEIKINIETFDREIFSRVCGKMDFDWILEAIAYACKVFDRGKVASNIIYGLGETDENVIEGMECLARMGCLPTLRAVRLDEVNRRALERVLGPLEPLTPERMIRLAREQKWILELYGLDPTGMRTMCFACRCCDIVPFVDV